ncbi:Na+/H+ antiporter subunit E [Brevundimonas naejangsanensis]|uniref:Na+/H+ antiporter subunit E n=1 Tax=Brevundimonas naejangsanensis TaxID=588932 RepID=UPI000E878C73|nr:Na+/H+ antiporter subunit E [Brevundimonas naejangsanensis]HAC00696.1 Na+/H+ antiporter subunit E [Brevundimonas sp.]HAL06252.1 Na+/H+ antiporter subunit E [Brevundimonas sp.]HBV13709.1 Na+/H+ antiporter subunit E [Brevundimonas sp.]HCW49621.1 Na+/H+ antiporter subunit E [Brevundimonas sp.]
MIRAVLPHPILSLGLFGASLLLSGSTAPPSLALALLMALAAPQIMRVLDVEPVRLRKPLTWLSFAVVVARDVIRSNWEVALVVLGLNPSGDKRVSGFVHIPLEMRNRYGLAVLAVVITSTPGTIWVEYEDATGVLLLHILDLQDGDDWAERIKNRYERRLMEIFE